MQCTTQGKHDPVCARPEMALSHCLVESDPEATTRARRTRRKTFGMSLAIEVLLLGSLVATPLLTSVAQPQLHQILPPQLTFFGAWREHTPALNAASGTTAHKPEFPNPFLPIAQPGRIAGDQHIDETGDIPIPDFPGGNLPGEVQAMEIGRTPPPVEPAHLEQSAQHEKRPVKLSQGVLEAQLVSRIEPRYPPLALQTRQAGSVVLHAIISRDGRINALEVVSGSPFFVHAALNGEAVEVETTITVVFRLQR
jgi:Gram-negative bacterial TonB protein C-terminal